MRQVCERSPSKGICRLQTVQAARPAPKSGGIGHPIRIFHRGRSLFPRAVLYKTSPECLSTSQQAVMGIWERKQRKEGEGSPAKLAKSPSDPNPVVVSIVCLLAAATVTDDGIAFTNRASAQQDVFTVACPIGFNLVRLVGKWDKNNRCCIGILLSTWTRQDLSRKQDPFSSSCR